MLGCPNQELAPLGPCTVSAVREEVSQSGISKVDLLFVIDNSLSMAEEQANLADQLPRLVQVLTTGKRPGKEDFVPVRSLQLAVITTDVAGTAEPLSNIEQCAEGNTADGVFQSSTRIAVEGETFENSNPPVVVPPLEGCEGVNPYHYQQFEVEKGSSAEDVADQFRCSAYVGVSGCAFEQQLEAMLKAVAPSDDTSFVGKSKRGHGNPDGQNAGFVRPDAILGVIIVSDEEDCSVTEAGRELFNTARDSDWNDVGLNVRCGVADGDADTRKELLQPIDRYVKGLQKLKPENPDRIIFAGIVGIPVELEDKSTEEILADDSMQFVIEENDPGVADDSPKVSCIVTRNGKPEWAYPPRRIVEVAGGFGENAALFSICRDDYSPAVDSIIDKIAAKLTGNCLPRVLTPGPDGKVACEVFEILEEGLTKCNSSKHEGKPEERTVEGKKRVACKMKQIPVIGQELQSNGDHGWYYDYFTEETVKECTRPGEQQRINFTKGGGELDVGSGASFECFQSVSSIGGLAARGFEAINTSCFEDEGICAGKSDDTYKLVCIEELSSCQVDCKSDPDCPPGWVCAKANGGGKGPQFCQQPTCPQGAE